MKKFKLAVGLFFLILPTLILAQDKKDLALKYVKHREDDKRFYDRLQRLGTDTSCVDSAKVFNILIKQVNGTFDEEILRYFITFAESDDGRKLTRIVKDTLGVTAIKISHDYVFEVANGIVNKTDRNLTREEKRILEFHKMLFSDNVAKQFANDVFKSETQFWQIFDENEAYYRIIPLYKGLFTKREMRNITKAMTNRIFVRYRQLLTEYNGTLKKEAEQVYEDCKAGLTN